MGEHVQAGIGQSKADDPKQAGEEVASNALGDLGKDSLEDGAVALVFCSGSKYGADEGTAQSFADGVESVFEEYGRLSWAGCTSAGEIIQGDLDNESAVALVLSSEYLDSNIGVAEGVMEGPKEAGENVAEAAVADLGADGSMNPYIQYLASKHQTTTDAINTYKYFLFMFSPGLTFDEPGKEDQVIDGVFEEVGRQIPIIGGTSGDDLRMVESFQFHDGKAYSDAAVAVAVSTGLKIGFSFGHGYEATNKSALVTGSSGYTVQELNGNSAMEEYAHILDMEKSELWDSKSKMMEKTKPIAKRMNKLFSKSANPENVPFLSKSTSNPLGIINSDGNISIRTPKGSDGDAITFNQQVPENVTLCKLEMDEGKIYRAEKDTVQEATEDAGGDPDVIFLFDCALRRAHIGEEKMEEIFHEFSEAYDDSTIIGFNTMGEYSFKRDSSPMTNCVSISAAVLSDTLITD